MHRSSSPWRFSTQRDRSNAVTVTKEQIEKQLAAVTELYDYNANYLEDFERAWISHIIDSAIAVVAGTIDEDECMFQPERVSRNSAWLREKLSTRRLRSISKDLALPQDQLKVLLDTAKSLNSALGLLSCCYDRWLWLKSSKDSDIRFAPTANDLQDFFDWKRQGSGYRRGSLSPVSERERQTLAVNALNKNGLLPSRRSTDTSGDSETQLSFVVDTVEKWRQNAEDALTATTKRYQGRTLGSLLRRDREASSSIGPEVSNTVPVQIARSSRPLDISMADFISNPPDLSNRRNTLKGSKLATSTSTHYDYPTHPNPIVPRRPVAQSAAFHTPEWPNSEAQSSSSSTSQSQSPPLSRSIHQPFLGSLQNSFEKESVSTDTLPFLSPPPHASTETIQNIPVSIPYSLSEPAVSSSGSNRMYLQSMVPNGRSQSEVSSESSAGASTIFSQSTNDATLSFQSKSSDGKLVPRSRGRLWLEQQEESERSKQWHP